MSNLGKIKCLAGTVIRADTAAPVSNFEVARVGSERLLGEVIRIDGKEVDIQVYEEIDGVHVGEPVEFTGEPLGVDLGPGLLGSVLDGIGRPLGGLPPEEAGAFFLKRGFFSRSLDPETKWAFSPLKAPGDTLSPGDALGFVEEGENFKHLVMAPLGSEASRIREIASPGTWVTVDDAVAVLENGR